MLYEHSEKRLVDRLKLEAGFHGIKLDDGNSNRSTAGPKSEHGVPGDPDSYEEPEPLDKAKLYGVEAGVDFPGTL